LHTANVRASQNQPANVRVPQRPKLTALTNPTASLPPAHPPSTIINHAALSYPSGVPHVQFAKPLLEFASHRTAPTRARASRACTKSGLIRRACW
jgi:hypothetical protein